MTASVLSGLLRGSATNEAHVANSAGSQRSWTKRSSTKPSVTMTWASAFTTATLVPGRSCRWWLASMCGVRTRSMRRGSTTMSFAPSRSLRFMREANTGWPSVGLAPMTTMTSDSATESKSWVPAEVPKACLRP